MINRQELVELLRAAACPDENCNEGVVSHMDAYGEPDCSQCQFCYEREQAIESLQAAEPVGYVTQEFIDGKFNLDHISNTSKGQINRVIPVYTAPPAPAAVPDKIMDIIKAVAHIGIDWGFGVYELEQHHIDSAREIHEAASPDPERPAKSHNWDDAGERCLDCGDKDWFAEPVCEGKKEEAER